MIKRVTGYLLMVLIIASALPMVEAQPNENTIALEENEDLYFDAANASLAITILGNSQTDYDVYFYGIGWSYTLIENWDNNGDVYFQDDTWVGLDNVFLNGTVYLENTPIVDFEDSEVKIININSQLGAPLQLTNCLIHELVVYNYISSVLDVELVNTVVQYLGNRVFLDSGVSEVRGLLLLGEIYGGVNITADGTSTVEGGYMVITSYYSYFITKITGYNTLSYEFSLNGGIGAGSEAEVSDVQIGSFGYFTDLANLTMTNIRLDVDYLAISTSNCNGTIDTIYDIDPVRTNTEIRLENSMFKILNADVGIITINCDGDTFDPSFWTEINSTVVRRNLNYNALGNFRYDNLTVNGLFYLKVVAFQSIAAWVGDGQVLTAGVYQTTIFTHIIFTMAYKFVVMPDVTLTINSSSVYDITGFNSTVLLTDCTIYDANFGDNMTVIYINCTVASTTFETDNKAQIYYSVVENLHLAGGVNCSVYNTSIDYISVAYNDETLYLYFYDVYIDRFNGDGTTTMNNAHVFMVDSEVRYVWAWNWGGLGELSTINSIIQTLDTYVGLVYNEDHTKLSWVFESSMYGDTETGVRRIQRRELVNSDTYQWSDWEEIGTSTGNFYLDYTAVEGITYSYRVLNVYSTGFFINMRCYDLEGSLNPAKTPLEFTLIPYGGEMVLMHPTASSVELQFGFRGKCAPDLSNCSDLPGEAVVQYEFFMDGEAPSQVNVSLYSQNVVVLTAYSLGTYHFKARVTSLTVNFWSEWQEVVFEVYTSTAPTTDPTTDDDSGSSPILGIVNIFSALVVVDYLRRKRKVN